MRMLNRHKTLLNTMEALNRQGIHSRTAIVKSQFILKEEYNIGEKSKFYHFYPYNYGPFSGLCYYDLRNLKKDGYINDEETALTDKGKEFVNRNTSDFTAQISNLVERFPDEKMMLAHVYDEYPQYTIKSKLVKNNIEAYRGVCTIGYEGLDIDQFLNTLLQNHVNLVIDVRRNPFSMNLCYIKAALTNFLHKADIEYLHIPELGIDSKHRKKLETFEDYQELFRLYRKTLPNKQVYINRILELSEKKRVALLCYEKDPAYCHRNEIASVIRTKRKVSDL